MTPSLSEKENKNWPFVTVAVSLYNSAERIGRTLDALLNQNYPADRYEIVTIDNASKDNTKEVVDRYVRTLGERVKYFYEATPGLAHARNRGAREAKGEIICYTDDDCIADKNWVKEIAQTVIEHDADAVQGKIIIGTKIPEDMIYPKWFIEERFAHVDYGDHLKQIYENDLVGANMSFRREVFEKYGYFDSNPLYDMCQDTEFSMRITKNGIKKFYNPKAVIYHHFSLDRINGHRFLKQSFDWGRAYLFLEPADMSDFKYFLFRLKKIFVDGFRLLKAYLKRDQREVFLIKCKIYSHWGRCYQLMQNAKSKLFHPRETQKI